MAENKFPCSPGQKETVCIETNRVLDSCRDRDCFENVRVYLSDCGNEILEHTGSIRVKSADIVWTYIGIDPIRFNHGFYSVNIRFYVKIVCEACVCIGQSQELEGIAVLEKRVILYGGESNVSIYRSNANSDDSFCCGIQPCNFEKNVPTAVVEVVSPVLLGSRVLEHVSECNCCCCCQSGDVPESVLSGFDSAPVFDDGDGNGRRYLTVSLGLFSVVRLVRPGQYLVQASEYNVPEKECRPIEEDNPCNAFRNMPFPIGEFCAGPVPPISGDRPGGHCSCGS